METIIRTKLVDTYYGAPLEVEWECTNPACESDADCQCDPDLEGPGDDVLMHYWQ